MALFTDFEIKEFNAASLTGSFQNLGAAISYPCYEAVITNDSDVDVYISIDGSTNNFRINAGDTISLRARDISSLSQKASYLFKEGTQLQIKQVTGSGTGSIVLNLLMAR